jgi:hypothetical protein
MYNSTQSTAWFKKSLLVTSLLTAIYQTAGAADTTAKTTSSASTDDSSERMTVTAPAPLLKAGSEHSIGAQELQDKGANDFGSIMRYEPLISATGASGGSGNGKSGFDRGGYTGYNIRGMESNRVGIDVDGIAQPNATGATPAARASIPSVWAATILTPICTAASIFSPGRHQPKPPTAPSAATSLSARNPRMTICIRAKPAPSATAAATTRPIAAGTTASPLPAAMRPCAGSSSTAVATVRKRK